MVSSISLVTFGSIFFFFFAAVPITALPSLRMCLQWMARACKQWRENSSSVSDCLQSCTEGEGESVFIASFTPPFSWQNVFCRAKMLWKIVASPLCCFFGLLVWMEGSWLKYGSGAAQCDHAGIDFKLVLCPFTCWQDFLKAYII